MVFGVNAGNLGYRVHAIESTALGKVQLMKRLNAIVVSVAVLIFRPLMLVSYRLAGLCFILLVCLVFLDRMIYPIVRSFSREFLTADSC